MTVDNQPGTKYIVVVKRDCPTCVLVEPILQQLDQALDLVVYSQDDPAFPTGVKAVHDDESLSFSYHNRVETVPTLIHCNNGVELERTVGWDRDAWVRLTGVPGLGQTLELPGFRPGCGSRSVDPGMPDKLALKFGSAMLASRKIEISEQEDDYEACFDRGWSDGLPVVPPTELRVIRMLSGTRRSANEVIGRMPPDLVPLTIEKIAINAVMAGCKPEYLPVVIAVMIAALKDEFCLHGLIATTYFSGPMVIVNGPLSRAIGMNSGGNALGQGNRANASIGRALQLIIRNVGGGKPGGVDRATFGNPGKYTFCFAEDEANSCWESLAVERGFSETESTVTLFAADGVQGIVDQKSRDPDSLSRSFAAGLRVVSHPKMVMAADAFLVVSPEHERVFRDAGWSKQNLKDRLAELLMIPGKELVQGANGITEGIPEKFNDSNLPKFRPGGLNIVRAGGTAGLFSAIIAGWGASGTMGSSPVTVSIDKVTSPQP